MDKATPTPSPATVESVKRLAESLERAHLRACSDTFDEAADLAHGKAWDDFNAELERLAAQAAPTDADQLMGMNEAEIDAELLAAGISPDDAVKRADRAIKGALATIRAERRAIEYGDIIQRHVLAMRAAVVASHLESPEAGMLWIKNTLFGPGHLPDVDEAIELGGAQALFDKEMAEHEAFRAAHPLPTIDAAMAKD